MRKQPPKTKQDALDAELRRMWGALEQGTPHHLYSTIQQLQDGAKPDEAPSSDPAPTPKRRRKTG